jgi:2-oxoglutarate ferredoxin oxidoreductase subunit beta
MTQIVPTDRPPERAAQLLDDFKPALMATGTHQLCPGCGEPVAVRALTEAIEALELTRRTMCVIGIGCYTAFSSAVDVEMLQALHGRAPSLATGLKRVRPDGIVFTLQGDGDMVNEGLQEVIHAAARAERVTCVMLNNGVFGETGGHMTATTVIGQRTKNTLEGRDPAAHGYPILLSDIIAGIQGSAFVGRGAVNSAGEVARLGRMFRRAFELQAAGAGFTFVEVLTMCPTGWFVDVPEGPGYLKDHLSPVHTIGVLKDVGPRPHPLVAGDEVGDGTGA